MRAKAKVLIFIVSYNAERFIEHVLERIPEQVWESDRYDAEVLVIDDQSSDRTFFRAQDFVDRNPNCNIQVLYNPVNQGYGGNQKLGYRYAISRGFDLAVLLHGDGQYAPEYLDQLIDPIVEDEADVVLGSRMIARSAALRGGMPLYKWVGNQILTFVQNQVLGANLSEFHTGYRSYSTKALKQVPFEYNSNYFDFDTDILIQMLDTGQRIKEVAIPTYYGNEICRVNGLRYAALVLRTTVLSRIVRLNLLYHRRFDYKGEHDDVYTLKLGFPSSHEFALACVKKEMTVLDIGSGPGYMARALCERGCRVISLDREIRPMTRKYSSAVIETEVEEFDSSALSGQVDVAFLLDIIEHVRDPEQVLLRFRSKMAGPCAPTLVVTTGNVAFFLVRLGLLLGNFNYGKKGILDRDHRRLFTFGSLRRLLDATGYDIIRTQGIPAPYPHAIGENWVSRALLALNSLLIRIWRGMFSYQIAMIAHPRPTLEQLLERAEIASLKKLSSR